ncbi:hypothetical protein C8A03DRAFT_19186 [Achaetomium macrosporum]|uniref:Uncharacterized protein n=1 Tax=Achaetomium macrosporum TaxID=79813 RepID=A0AAN7C3I0_9PEZI|nr:hypothetical protein C8A03DRAFT_19186 [Achaetomium macrosporum]
MSRSTPRKSRHRHHASNSGPRQVNASDYESDTAHYMENREAAPPANPQQPRDNTELSLRVLRRYQPSIRSILAIAANAVAYSFLESTQGWEKHGAEGTMFVCEQEPILTPTGQVLPRVCVFVLNRRSMDNLVLDLLKVTDCEVVEELIVFRLEDDGAANNNQGEDGSAGKKIIGLWIHADESNTREVHANLILGAWQQGRQAFDAYVQAATAGVSGDSASATNSQAAAASSGGSAAGKRLSIEDHKPSTGKGDDVVNAAVQTQLSLVASFEQFLARRIESDSALSALDSRLRDRLADYWRWLCEVEQTSSEHVPEDAHTWGIEARIADGSDNETTIIVTGPSSGEPIKIAAKDTKDAEDMLRDGRLGDLMTICRAFSTAQDIMCRLLQARRDMQQEEARLSQPAEDTVNTYIRRLQEYNDMKDIGQQLIGLVADNRGVPIRTLYETGEYGVKVPR